MRITVPRAVKGRIAELNAHWAERGMPNRCAVPATAAGWRALLKSLPGYDPFRTAAEGLRFSVERAVRAIGFFHEYLKHSIGEKAGTPLWLEPWQQAFLGNLFGWARADGTRRYREFMLYVARKNGKTTLLAGIMLFLLLCDGEHGAQLFCAAYEREQAKVLFKQACDYVHAEPELGRCTVYQHHLVDEETGSTFKVLTADSRSSHGLNPHAAIVDELHTQPNRGLWDALQTGMGSRRQPLMGAITTADHERPSLCNEMHDRARRVRDGAVDDWAFLPAVYEAADGDPVNERTTWAKANPNLGVSVSEEFLAAQAERAEREKTYTETFRQLHLNVRTKQSVRWLDVRGWDALPGLAAVGGPDGAARADAVAVGVDLSYTRDMTSMGTLWRVGEAEEALYGYRLRVWYPEKTAERRERETGLPVSTWAREGWVTLTEGSEIDYAQVEGDILDQCRLVGVVDPAFDPWQARQVMQNLTREGLEPVTFAQSFANYAGPVTMLEKLIAEGRLCHDHSPVMSWMVSNAVLDRDRINPGGGRPSKKNSAEQIDGVISLVMALGQLTEGERGEPTVYGSRGLLVI